MVNAMILTNLQHPENILSLIEYQDYVIKALADLDKSYQWGFNLEEDPVLPPAAPVDPLAPVDPDLPVVGEEAESQVKGKVFKRYRRANMASDIERLKGIHTPVLLDSKNRRRCVFHPKIKERHYCPTCDVCLCLSASEEDSCWFKFHHEQTWRK